MTSKLGVFLLWLPDPARQSKKQFFGSSFLLESGITSEALELLVGFITYLEPALWLENTKLVKFMLSQTLTLGVFDPWP